MTRRLFSLLFLFMAVAAGCARPSSQARRLRQVVQRGSESEVQSELNRLFDVGSAVSDHADLLSFADGVLTNAEDQEIAFWFGDLEGQQGDQLALILIDSESKRIKAVRAETAMK